MELLVYPAIYEVWRWRFHLNLKTAGAGFARDLASINQGEENEKD
jgi:hypothetical protein